MKVILLLVLTLLIVLATFLNLEVVQGQEVFNPVTAHFLDTSTGLPGVGVLSKFYKKSTNDGDWNLINSQLTDGEGRIGKLISEQDFTTGSYKIWFDSSEYYSRTNTDTWYPFVEIVFDVTDLFDHYHVPLLLSPFGYSSYKGTYSPPSSTTPPPVPNPIRGFLLNTLDGMPAGNVKGELYRLGNDSNWDLLATKNTTISGGFSNLFTDPCDFTVGVYKMSFDTKSYWTARGYVSFFPTVDVIINVQDTEEVYLAPILINPYSFTTNKGNLSDANPVTC